MDKELVNQYAEQIADDMYQRMSEYVGQTLDKIEKRNRDYSLMTAYNRIKEGLTLPPECKFELRGYELILNTPMPIFIRFGMGNFWIGGRLIVVKYLEEIVCFFRYLITDLLAAALEDYRIALAEIGRRTLKIRKLRSLYESNGEGMIRSALSGTGLKFELSFHTLSATVKILLPRDYFANHTLRYEYFVEDLRTLIDTKVPDYVHQHQHEGA